MQTKFELSQEEVSEALTVFVAKRYGVKNVTIKEVVPGENSTATIIADVIQKARVTRTKSSKPSGKKAPAIGKKSQDVAASSK